MYLLDFLVHNNLFVYIHELLFQCYLIYYLLRKTSGSRHCFCSDLPVTWVLRRAYINPFLRTCKAVAKTLQK